MDVLSGGREPDGRQPPGRFLLDRGDDPPPAPLKLAHESLGIVIIGDEHGEIGVTGQSRLGARRDRQAADQGKAALELVEISDDTTKSRFGSAQGRDGGQEMERPQESPCSAPGRVSSQATSMASISSSVAKGCSRRSCARRIDSPRAQRSSAVRNRAASVSGESSATLSF